jgi:hypothetical protein
MGTKELTRIERWNWLLGALLVLVSILLAGQRFFSGVAVGVLLAGANFWVIHRLIRLSLSRPDQKRAAIQLLLVAKMGALAVLVFLVMRFLPISPIGLIIGLSVFLLSIAIESVRFVLGHKASDGRA